MVQQIISAIIPILVTALVAVLTVVIKGLGDAAVNYIIEKMKAVKAKAGADKWNFWTSLARQAWNITEENTRIAPTLDKTIAAKQTEFERQIRKMIPGITDDEIVQLRQAVAGEINKGKAAITGQTNDEQENGLSAIAPAIQAPAQPESGAVAPNTNGAA